MTNLVSIIVPVYNAEKYLYKTIQSILQQTYCNFELLLVNDGSTDSSMEICEAAAKKDERIIILNKTNGGVSSARNYGIEHSRGEYIIFIDSDDFLMPDMLQTLVEDIECSDSDVAVCGFAHLSESEYVQEKDNFNACSRVSVLENPIQYFYIKKYIANIWNKLFKKELLNNIRFDETIHYGEDFLFVAIALIGAKKISYREDVKYFYIKRENGLSMQEGSVEFWQGYARGKKMLYDKFIAIHAPENLLQGVWREYFIALIAVYRYVVHKRLKNNYIGLDRQYRKIMLDFIKNQKLPILKRLEYFSFVFSYDVAVLLHKKY